MEAVGLLHQRQGFTTLHSPVFHICGGFRGGRHEAGPGHGAAAAIGQGGGCPSQAARYAAAPRFSSGPRVREAPERSAELRCPCRPPVPHGGRGGACACLSSASGEDGRVRKMEEAMAALENRLEMLFQAGFRGVFQHFPKKGSSG